MIIVYHIPGHRNCVDTRAMDISKKVKAADPNVQSVAVVPRLETLTSDYSIAERLGSLDYLPIFRTITKSSDSVTSAGFDWTHL